jgi:hypothetical protein
MKTSRSEFSKTYDKYKKLYKMIVKDFQERESYIIFLGEKLKILKITILSKFVYKFYKVVVRIPAWRR